MLLHVAAADTADTTPASEPSQTPAVIRGYLCANIARNELVFPLFAIDFCLFLVFVRICLGIGLPFGLFPPYCSRALWMFVL